MNLNRLLASILIGAPVIAVGAACNDKGLAYGDPNSIIAVMSPDQWDATYDDLYDALEKTVQTVRDEKTFTVTYQEPYVGPWMNLRRFRQILVVGSRSDQWIRDVLEEASEPIDAEGLHQIHDVWSIGQTITLLLMPEGWGADDLRPHLESVSELLDGQYRSYARNRMFMSGVDSALADTLSTEQGFLVFLPQVYRWEQTDSVFVFRNDNPDPAELIRQIAITWLSPAPAQVDVDDVLAWRTRLVDQYYSEPQDLVIESVTESSFDHPRGSGLQLQAQWRNPPERGWPAGGPLITRVLTCESQDRTYLIDAWLYAPGKEKYEYMIQLETIMDTFRCDS